MAEIDIFFKKNVEISKEKLPRLRAGRLILNSAGDAGRKRAPEG
jgi:hypothetical protein